MNKNMNLLKRNINQIRKEGRDMFKNCVFKPDVDTVKWLKAAGIRAIKTVAQTAIATIGASTTMGDVNWAMVGNASLLSGIISLLTSVAGIPEVKEGE